MLLTDELLLYYKRCRRRAFLDRYGDPTQQDAPQDFLLKLRQDSFAHKQTVLGMAEPQPTHCQEVSHSLQLGMAEPQPTHRQEVSHSLQSVLPPGINLENLRSPNYPRNDWGAGARATVELMQQGTDCIYQGVLLVHEAKDITLVSCPDLLIKEPGESEFGDWMYVPLRIKFGKRPKAEYQLIAALDAQLLAINQRVLPTIAWLILRRQESYAVKLEKWLPLMQEELGNCIEILQQHQEPEVFISRQKCSLCHWYSSCYAIAQSQQHLSLLPGVTPNRYRDLQSLGIKTLEALAETPIRTLEFLFGDQIADDLVQQAQATLQNRAILRQRRNVPVKTPPLEPLSAISENGCSVSSTQEPTNDQLSPLFDYTDTIPTASVELFFDIEAEPDLKLDYLLGILVIDRSANTEMFYPFLAKHPQEEASIWQQFLDLVGLYPDAPIFHFSDYEVETVKRLAKLYNTPLELLEPLLSRFVDMHQRVVNTVMLPVESYSLKNLARWLGFEWRDAGITGSQCVCLYNQWLKTGDRSFLDAIQRYNEDDCRATYHLKDWLFSFLQEHSPL
ncbi:MULTISPECIES: TM0106 family RecB-like putative nuclease [unclassified Coleofasciculus]|uniref:TM0106 family RecB-like putative nuclease n=1 Tax=unclassified Coleofasciculus TaxID=2692782 RepID=UPI001882DF6A|nr:MULTISPECIES: TM0106 family RecB-like putative nuclease [unclassified Coleofasciculus]MBE9124979.1 TM0106 family RecB-like putative nuclease [Coleofasciculus sp. LEGE 07081]MBE9148003.1 TM0106 family RecB-like putative nuclease [Coleofasciculus sp. LEGE 07092]